MVNSADQQAEKSLIGHLLELRSRLIKSLLALLAGFMVSYLFSKQIYAFIAAPLKAVLPVGSHLIFTSVPEVFITYVKLSFLAGFFLALPVILYQFWAFIAPGLYQHERRLFFPLLFVSVLLFFGGAAFAYYLVFPAAFKFFISFAGDDISAMPAVKDYLSLSVTFLLTFGAAFQIPVVTVVLTYIGIVPIDTLKRGRRYALLACFVIAAIVTPPDVMSQFMLAVPMYILFELGLFFSTFAKTRARRDPAVEPVEDVQHSPEDENLAPEKMDDALDAAEQEFDKLHQDKPPSDPKV